MDLTKYRQKLIGNEQERAVSPVIGVILMVAITVILAAVIAAFVLDMGSGLETSASAGVSISGEEDSVKTVSIESMADADKVEIRDDGGNEQETLTAVGETASFSTDGTDGSNNVDEGTYSVVALFDDGSGSNTIATFELEA